MKTILTGNVFLLFIFIGRVLRRTLTARTIVTVFTFRIRSPPTSTRITVASGAFWTMSRAFVSRIQRKPIRIPIRPCKGSLGRAIRTSDEASKPIASARTGILYSHATRIPLPITRKIRKTILSRTSGTISCIIIQSIFLPSFSSLCPNPT